MFLNFKFADPVQSGNFSVFSLFIFDQKMRRKSRFGLSGNNDALTVKQRGVNNKYSKHE